MHEPGGEIIVYQNDDGRIKLDVRLVNETLWMTQAEMANLFQTTKQNISLHLQDIYEEGELLGNATVKDFLTVRQEGSRQVKCKLTFHKLDAEKTNPVDSVHPVKKTKLRQNLQNRQNTKPFLSAEVHFYSNSDEAIA